MIGFNSTHPETLWCGWCGEEQDGNHAPCVVALRNVGLGYCAACGDGFDVNGQQHDDCMVFLTGRPDLLEPTPEDRASLERLIVAIEAAVLDGTIEAAVLASRLADQARWN